MPKHRTPTGRNDPEKDSGPVRIGFPLNGGTEIDAVRLRSRRIRRGIQDIVGRACCRRQAMLRKPGREPPHRFIDQCRISPVPEKSATFVSGKPTILTSLALSPGITPSASAVAGALNRSALPHLRKLPPLRLRLCSWRPSCPSGTHRPRTVPHRRPEGPATRRMPTECR